MSESLEKNNKKVDYNNLTLEQKAAYAYVLNTIFKNAFHMPTIEILRQN